MSNNFIGSGNLGGMPELSYFKDKKTKEQKPVVNFSVFINRDKPNPNGNGYVDNGGFWLPCSWFGKKAERTFKIYNKGVKVRVEGSLKLNTWIDKETNESKSRIELEVTEVNLDPIFIESVIYSEKNNNSSSTPTNQFNETVEQTF